MNFFKAGLKMVVSGLVGLFTGAIVDTVSANATGTKIAKIGAKAGGALVGYYIGDKVTEHIMSDIEEMLPDNSSDDDEDDEEEEEE